MTKYINTAYLYQTEDFETGTLLEVADELNIGPDDEITTTASTKSVSDLQATLQQFANVANYYKYIRSAQNISICDFEIHTTIESTSINNTQAEVHIYTLISYLYSGATEPTICGDNFKVYFTRIESQWIITDIYAEEIEAFRLTYDEFNCQEGISTFNELERI